MTILHGLINMHLTSSISFSSLSYTRPKPLVLRSRRWNTRAQDRRASGRATFKRRLLRARERGRGANRRTTAKMPRRGLRTQEPRFGPAYLQDCSVIICSKKHSIGGIHMILPSKRPWPHLWGLQKMETLSLVWIPHRLANDEWKVRSRRGGRTLSMFYFWHGCLHGR